MNDRLPDWSALRAEFPTLERWTYLDVARKTVPPRCQERAFQEYTRDIYETAGAESWAVDQVTGAREALARLLGAKPAEIAFTKNTTDGLNIAAHAFELRAGDNVVLSDMEHTANLWVWKHWEAKGVELRKARSRDARLPLDAFEEQMDARTRVVSTAWVTYGNGYRVDLPGLAKLCRARGVRLVADGVQGAGILATPLGELGPDMIAIGGHKALFGLTGSGILYCREALVEQVTVPFVKQAQAQPGVSAHANSQFDYMRIAHRFEGGNPNFLGARVLRAGAAFIESIGLSRIETRVRALTDECLRQVKAAGLTSRTPQEWGERAQIVSVPVADAAGVMARLREKHRIIVNVKDEALRLSMSFFNNEEDIEKTVSAIKREIS
ncbi:MAG: aminotransferase class V-fold PLP-dependent enzyme [Burkholderiales bacterium]|nr:aminotransferase class V-fold PLP-dependent enzyme [Burkholderiales bacterium]